MAAAAQLTWIIVKRIHSLRPTHLDTGEEAHVPELDGVGRFATRLIVIVTSINYGFQR